MSEERTVKSRILAAVGVAGVMAFLLTPLGAQASDPLGARA